MFYATITLKDGTVMTTPSFATYDEAVKAAARIFFSCKRNGLPYKCYRIHDAK